MERLTWHDAIGQALLAPTYNDKYDALELIDILLDKLAAYEDTGLEPETIKNWMLTQNLIDSGITPALIGTPLKHLFELASAEAEGRLLVLPCKVGDTVYTIIDGKIYEGEVYHISYSDYYGKVTSAVWTKIDFLTASIGAAFEDFGKTVFLTREEAEAALKKDVESDG